MVHGRGRFWTRGHSVAAAIAGGAAVALAGCSLAISTDDLVGYPTLAPDAGCSANTICVDAASPNASDASANGGSTDAPMSSSDSASDAMMEDSAATDGSDADAIADAAIDVDSGPPTYT